MIQAAAAVSGLQSVVEDSPVVFANTPRLPDFTVVKLTPSSQHPAPGDTVTVDVQVGNDGMSFHEFPISIVATWDGGPGVGEPAGEEELLGMPAGVPQTVTLTLAEPPGGYALVHDLVVTVNPDQAMSEPDATDNSLSTTLGGLPAPSDVSALVKPGSSTVFLQWTELEHGGVAGYRVYRSEVSASGAQVENGTEVPVGSTFVGGFVDFTAEHDRSYRYRVSSFSEDGFESEFSNAVEVVLSKYRISLPTVLRNGR
jgi:hypothetical protein